MSLCFLAMLSFPLYSASPVFYMQNSSTDFFVSVCVSFCVCPLQLRLKNPSSKPVKYRANIFGENAHLFSLPNGSAVTLSSKYV